MNEKRVLIMDAEEKETGRMKEILAGTFPVLEMCIRDRGESGCGKTTTGRSIIKLYDITSGSVYFKGIRIAAGTRSYVDAIHQAKKEYKQKIAAAGSESEKKRLENELDQIIAENKKEIKAAEYDQKHCDKE